MPINFEDYISTSLRWAMFKSDWPDATVEFTEGNTSDAGIPVSFSKKDEKVVIATITRYADDNRPIVGYKTQSDARSRDTDAWNVLCSKAMGRALKKAGYPDTMTDMKVFMRYREATGKAVAVAPPANENKMNIVAGQNIQTQAVTMESKEQPNKPVVADWRSDTERDEAHRLFKQMSGDLSPNELETLRTEHLKLNNRAWPMPKAQLNALVVTLEGIKATRKGEPDGVDTAALIGMLNFLSERAKQAVVDQFGDPSTWPSTISEDHYNRMMDAFEAASEAE